MPKPKLLIKKLYFRDLGGFRVNTSSPSIIVEIGSPLPMFSHFIDSNSHPVESGASYGARITVLWRGTFQQFAYQFWRSADSCAVRGHHDGAIEKDGVFRDGLDQLRLTEVSGC